jgi:hypothetical protein
MPKCKVACGHCCKFWKHAFPESKGRKCPHLEEDGCAFSYAFRPQVCQEFICPLGEAASKACLDNGIVQRVLTAVNRESAKSRRVRVAQEKREACCMNGDHE